jgi:diadenosine tetraphosphate (Ap4A) HIT family hydrolase
MNNFLELDKTSRLFENEHFFIIKDKYPVSPGHLLIITKELKRDYFELSNDEKENLSSVIQIAKNLIESEYSPSGYNIGMNCGEDAGQTVFHFHCHLIPRYKGDMISPEGGIRHCVAGKGYY